MISHVLNTNRKYISKVRNNIGIWHRTKRVDVHTPLPSDIGRPWFGVTHVDEPYNTADEPQGGGVTWRPTIIPLVEGRNPCTTYRSCQQKHHVAIAMDVCFLVLDSWWLGPPTREQASVSAKVAGDPPHYVKFLPPILL